jgi:PAS domain S-box-containing protein
MRWQEMKRHDQNNNPGTGGRTDEDRPGRARVPLDAEWRQQKIHLEAVIARRTAELKSANSRLHRLLYYIELSDRKLAADSLAMDIQSDSGLPPGIDEGVITADTDLRIVMINAPAAGILGFNEDEAMRKEIAEVFAIDETGVGAGMSASMRSMVAAGSPGQTIEDVQVRTKSGAVLTVSAFYEPIFDGDEGIAGIILTFRDADENRKKEYETIRNQQIESLNLVVRSLAHDFNNLLSSVLANVQLARMDLPKGTPGHEHLNSAEEAVLRAKELSRQMLTSSGEPGPETKPAGIASPIQDTGKPEGLPIPRKKKATGKKHILLMDDEEAILSATSDMLRFLGYEVETAKDGDTAAECFRKAHECGVPFDAVILDITVPGGRGAKETLPMLTSTDPHAKVIISSGYSTNPMITDYRSFGFAAAIVKPYGFKELQEALGKVFTG